MPFKTAALDGFMVAKTGRRRLSGTVVDIGDVESLCAAFRECHGVFHTSSFTDPAGLSGYSVSSKKKKSSPFFFLSEVTRFKLFHSTKHGMAEADGGVGAGCSGGGGGGLRPDGVGEALRLHFVPPRLHLETTAAAVFSASPPRRVILER